MGKVSRKVKRQLLAFFLVVCMIMQNGTSVLAESIPTEQSPAGTVQDEMLMTASDEAAAEQPEEAVVETPEQSENQGEEHVRTYGGSDNLSGKVPSQDAVEHGNIKLTKSFSYVEGTTELTEDQTAEVAIDNEYEKNYNIDISKQNIVGKEIGGAAIKITDAEGNTVEEWTTEEDRRHTVTVQPGTYKFHEEIAPTGYIAVTDIKFTVDEDGTVTVINTDAAEVDQNGKLVVIDEAIHFVVNKTDVTGETELEGAVIEIYEADEEGKATGDALETWTSAEGETHDFGAVLGVGKSYVLSETTAPNGYTAIADTAFSVNADGSIGTTLETKETDWDGNPIYLVEDAPVIHFVVNKTDVTGETELEGAVIEIYKADEEGKATGDALATWTSAEDETHDFGDKLEAGKSYVLSETTAPNGYTAIADTAFSVKADGSIETTLETKATDEDGNPIYLVEDAPVIHFVVNKTDVTGETELEGAVIEIYKADEEGKATGDALATWTSAEGETHDFGAVLEVGKSYVLSETTAPNGYTAIADTAFSVKADGSIETTLETKATDEDGNPIYLVEDAPVIHFVVNKTDVTGETELEGAVIEIYKADEEGKATGDALATWTSAEDETHDFGDKLEAGKSYVLSETTAPNGYTAIADTAFRVKADGSIETTLETKATDEDGNPIYLVEDAPVVIQPETGILEITKTIKGDITEEEAEGALKFKVTNPLTNQSTTYTLKDFTHAEGSQVYTLRLAGLVEGRYEVEETTSDITGKTVTVKYAVNGGEKQEGTSTAAPINKSQITTVAFEDDYKNIHFNVNKTELGNGEEVEGAKLEVLDKDGNVVDSWTSKKNETHDFGSKLKAGEEYTLRETVAPEGYSYTTDIAFNVETDGTVNAKLNTTKDEKGNVVYLVEDAPISFNVNKTELGNGKEVEGAKLQVIGKDKDGKEVVVDSWTSKKDETHDFGSKLKAGEEYTLRETVAPEGYSYTTDINFKVEKDGTITTEIPKTTDEDGKVTYLVEDAPISFNVNKTELGNGKEVEGAKLQVIGKDKDGKEVVVDSWTSKKDETHDFGSKLKAGEEYTLRETNAPEGYSYTTDINFKVEKDGTITTEIPKTTDEEGNVTYLVEDAPISFNVNKTELGNGKEVEGAKLQVIGKDKDGKEVVVDSWTSKKNETHDFGSKLKVGEEYTLRETNAPEGYSYTTDINFKVEKDGTITTEIPKTTDEDGKATYLVEDALISFNVNKTELGNGKEVEGAKLQVIGKDKDGKEVVVDSWTSKKNETHDFGSKLKAGEEYTLRETVAPEGYSYTTDINFKVEKDGTITTEIPKTTDEDGKVTYLVEDAPISFNVNKTELGNGKEVEGAKLQVIGKDKDGKEVVVDSWTSKKDETHDFGSKLKAGEEYTLRETNAPEGYSYTTDINFKVEKDGTITTEIPKTTDEEGNVTYLVEDAPISFNVNKTELGNGKEVEGAKLQVIGKDKDGKEVVVDSWTSKKNETHDFGSKLKAGEEYTLRETNAPEGYEVVTDIKFSVNKDGTISSTLPTTTDNDGKTVYLVNDKKIVHFNVNKTELGTGVEVEGAELQVIKKDKDGTEVVVDSWTSKKEETHDFGNVLNPNENYILRETVAPVGYKYVTDILFSVNENSEVQVEMPTTTDENGNVTYLVEDAPISFNVNKTELGNGKEVEGAKLQVIGKDKDGKEVVVDSWTSKKNETHDFGSKLKAGEEYTLRETVAPEGYSYTTDINFKVEKDGTITTEIPKTTDEEGNVTYLVEDAPISFNVNKTELGNGKEVEGAKLQVIGKDKDGKEVVVDSWTSKKNETHDFGSKLKAGEEYTLRETVAPEGYSYTTDINFKVEKDGTITTEIPKTTDEEGNVTYLVEDAPISFNVNKTELGNGKEVEGAKLQVIGKDKDGKEVVVDSWTSKKNETHDFGSKLKAGEEYTLRETVAPEGYSYTTDINFKVEKDGTITTEIPKTTDAEGNVTYLVEDAPISFNVNKTELGNGKEVEGAKLQVIGKDKDGKEVVVDSWTSKKDETHDFGSKLKAGEEYTLRETVAPEGYSYTTDLKFKVETDGTITTEIPKTTDEEGNVTYLVEDAPISFNVNKTDLETGEEVEGAKLEVVDKDGNIVDSWTSKKGETHDFGSKLSVEEKYTLRETVAPKGYSYTTDIEFSVEKDGKVTVEMTSTKDENGNVTYLVEDGKIHFILNEKTKDTEEEKDGAEIIIEDEDGNVVDKWTSEEGKTHDFGDKLEAGKEYTLKEKKAPHGYLTIPDMKVVIKEDGTIETDLPLEEDENGNSVIVVKENRMKGVININIHKENEQNPDEDLPGSTYGLYKIEENDRILIAQKVTDENGKICFDDLDTDGIYEVQELKAPDGSYVSKNPIRITFDINKDNELVTNLVAYGSGIAKINPETGEITWFDPSVVVRIHKVDKDNKQLAGAKLQILDKNGKEVVKFTTTDKPEEFVNLFVIGETYTLKELEAPAGYKIADPVKFTISDEKVGPNEDVVLEVKMVDEKKPASNNTTNKNTTTNTNKNTTTNTNKKATTNTSNNAPKTGDKAPIIPTAVMCFGSLYLVELIIRRKVLKK